jgi:hypothetical protein
MLRGLLDGGTETTVQGLGRRTWSSVKRVSFAALAAGLLCACSDATTGGTGKVPPSDDPGDRTTEPRLTPVAWLEVDTGVSHDAPAAGEVITVTCTVLNLAAGQEPPATRWVVSEQPAGAAEPVSSGSEVSFLTTGTYRVRCQIDETGWADPTPAVVKVGAAAVASLDTLVEPTEIPAGSTAKVTCNATDVYGNLVSELWKVVIVPAGASPGPQGGLTESGMKLQGIQAGSYDVACRRGTGESDTTPARVNVVHGLPHQIVTTLEDGSIPAGSQTKVSCHARDKQGNPVTDLPMTIFLPDVLALEGFSVGGTVAGKFVVKCVPAGLDWGAFVLEHAVLDITPGAAVSMDLAVHPPKPFFATYELITLLPTALDAYGNLIPNPAIQPVEVSPTQDYLSPTGTSLKFTVEGHFVITARLLDNPELADSVEVAIEGAPPVLVVEYPPRGATLVGSKPSVTVEGTAVDAIAGVQHVYVNGSKAVLKPDGSFTSILIPKWGQNLLEVEAEDAAGSLTQLKQSFYFAEKYHPIAPETAVIPDAIKVWIAKNFLDDGVHDPTHPDDLATLLETMLANLDLSGLLGTGADPGGSYKLTISGLAFEPPKLNLAPFDGGLQIHLGIKNFVLHAELQGECKVLFIDLCPDLSGTVSLDPIVIDVQTLASATEGVLSVSIGSSSVELYSLDLDIDGILGWLFDWLSDFAGGLFEDDLQDMVQEQTVSAIQNALEDLFKSTTSSQTSEIPPVAEGMPSIPLTFEAGVWTLRFKPDGGRVGLFARMLTPKNVPQQILGSIARGTCLKGYPSVWAVPGKSEYEVALYDDFLNHAMTALWQAGLFNLTLDQSADGGGGLGGLPFDSLSIKTTALLPPVLNGCDPSGILRIQIGDLFFDAEIESLLFADSGNLGKLGAYLYLELTAEILLTETATGQVAIALMLDELETLEFFWEYVPEPFVGSEEALEEILADMIEDKLAEISGKPLGEFTLPTIDLQQLDPNFAAGTKLVPAIEDLLRDGGHTLIQGHLE